MIAIGLIDSILVLYFNARHNEQKTRMAVFNSCDWIAHALILDYKNDCMLWNCEMECFFKRELQRIFVQVLVLLFLPQRNEIEDSHLIRMSVNPKNENGKLYKSSIILIKGVDPGRPVVSIWERKKGYSIAKEKKLLSCPKIGTSEAGSKALV